MKKKTLENANEMNMSGDTEEIVEPTVTDSESNGVDMSGEMEEAALPMITDSVSNEVVMYQAFTISKRLTSKEAVRLLNDFERYRKNPANKMYVKTISESGEDAFNDWWRKEHGAIKSSIRGYSYDYCMEYIWEIKEYSEVCKDFEYKEYFIDIIFEPIMTGNKELSYDGNLLKPIIDCMFKKSNAISPFFDDISSYVLKQIDYKVDIITELPLILDELQNLSNLPAIYYERESFLSDSSKASKIKTPSHMVSSAVKVCNSPHKYNNYKISRKFGRDYSMKELIDTDSAATKLIIKQMLSVNYLRRTAVAYLKTAIMGGSYYSISKAEDIINSSSIPIESKDKLMQTLELVEHYKGIYNAKLIYKDNKAELYDFINNLHELVELGINPVTIPQTCDVDELSNPILELEKKYDGDKKEADSYIEVEEVIGSLNVPCRIHRESKSM